MIDQDKLRKEFDFVGKDRLAYYIKLYLQTNKKFIVQAKTHFRNCEWQNLFELIHKTKGSSSIFYADALQTAFTQVENILLKDPPGLSGDDLEKLFAMYDEFIAELESF